MRSSELVSDSCAFLFFYLFIDLFVAGFVYKVTATSINTHLPEDSVKLPLIPANC